MRQPLVFMIEMLSAIPSVIYGLWAIFVMLPWLRANVFPLMKKTLGHLPHGAHHRRPVHRGAGRPVQRSARRGLQHVGGRFDHCRDDPAHHHRRLARDLAQRAGSPARGRVWVGRDALGSDAHRRVVLREEGALRRDDPRPRPRAGRDDGRHHGHRQHAAHRRVGLFAPGYTLASVIANEFAEASSDDYLHALIAIGFVLLIVTVIVNLCAQLILKLSGTQAGAVL